MTDADETSIDALLPWHAAGTLGRRDAERVEAALARDPELARRYALVREELAETVRLNEALGAPSPRPFERLMAQIEAEPAAGPARRAARALARYWEALLVRLSPRALAWSAAAAAVVILVQAGLLAGIFLSAPNRTYRTATVEQPRAAGSYVLIGFAPQANAADITQFLETYKAAIVDGPRAGGLYRIRIGQGVLPKDELARLVSRMQQERAVRFAAPSD
jgi:anti-sigma factor RsiW